MPNSELATISEPRASSSKLIREWVVKFGELCQCEITPALTAIWVEQLKDIPPELLDRACDRLAKTWTFGYLPRPGNIRAQIEQANANGLQLEAEQAWDWALDVACRCWFADLGGLLDAPDIPPEISFAVKAAGGWGRLHTCIEDDLVWCRKTFLERYTLLHETRQAEQVLSDGQAKRILADLARPAEQKRLAPPRTAEPQEKVPEPSEQEVLAGFAALREKLHAPRAVEHQAPSDEEWERRKCEQKGRFDAWLAEHREIEQPARSEPGPDGSATSTPKTLPAQSLEVVEPTSPREVGSQPQQISDSGVRFTH